MKKSPATKVKQPDTFDGSDPHKLNNFILLCDLYFRHSHNPSAYSDNSAKVTFALSHLRGLALDLFEPTILDSEETPDWLVDWSASSAHSALPLDLSTPLLMLTMLLII